MTSEHWGRVSEIFAEALDLAPSEREAYLDRCCADNPVMRREVEAMLRAELHTNGFLEGSTSAQPRLPNELPGGWTLSEKLGESEVGAVFRAQRKVNGVEEHAAVRMLNTSEFSIEAVRRLRSERRSLLELHHPSIARLLDTGAADGAPFLVVELVEGPPLLTYCTEKKLSTRQRLQLFLSICDGVQFAHQKLIVHRDIQASRVLVSATGQPKLLGFGTAKVNIQEPVTTALDVHGLGGLLRQLLTAGQRKSLSRDLEAIAVKASRGTESADDRYTSVEQLAADVQRHLQGLPVHARPATPLYIAGKFVRRNKLVALAGVGTFTGLITFAWATWYFASTKYRAEEHLQETRAIAGMMAMYVPGRIVEFPGSLDLRRKMVSFGLAYLDQQTADLDPADAKQHRLYGLGYFNVANALGGPGMSNLGNFDEALRCYRKVIDLLWQDGPPAGRDTEVHEAIGLSLTRRAESLLRLRRPAEALQAAEDCVNRASQVREGPIAQAELTCRGTRLLAMNDLAKPIPVGEVEDIIRRQAELEDKKTSVLVKMNNSYLAASLYLHLGDKARALEYAKAGLDVGAGPNRGFGVTIQRGRLLELTGRIEAALGDKENAPARFDDSFDGLRELIRKEPEEIEARTLLARALLESKEFAEDALVAGARLREAEALMRGLLKDASYPDARMLLGRILAAQSDLQNRCDLRDQALAEFGLLESARLTLPADGPVIAAVRAKACTSKP
jgi:serine/threonine protein kinase